MMLNLCKAQMQAVWLYSLSFLYTLRWQTETRKAELETNLSTNLVRRRQELEAVKVSGETDKLDAEAEAKKQELADATLLVEDVTQQLKSDYFGLLAHNFQYRCSNPPYLLWLNVLFAGVSGSIDERTRQLGKIKDEKNKLKVFFFWTSTVILSYGCWC